MPLRDRIRDEAIAVAKGCSHAAVEPRHVLLAIVHVLGSAAPAELTAAIVHPYLEPHGTALDPPPLTPEAGAILAAIDGQDAAIAQARAILAALQAPPIAGVAGGTPAAIAAALASSPGGAAAASGTAATGTASGSDASGAGTASAPGTTASGSTATATVTTSATQAAAGGPSAAPAAETVASILAELDGLIGLAPVKAEIHRLVAVQRLNAERRRSNLPEVGSTNHLVFTGSPGTGKTTVARIIARLYGCLGVVTRGQLVEATRADLVAGYVGQTALKVKEVVTRAIGGVLFIDEAYALSRLGDVEDYGAEAVATLVQLMEDNRANLVVIVAGYRDEMADFIRSNPGLRSRFTRYIEFPDYDSAELAQIFEVIAAQSKVRVADDVLPLVTHLLDDARQVEDFGNARFVRSLFERAYANMAARVTADDRIDPGELDLLVGADLPAVDAPATHEHHIGFRPAGAG